MSKLVTIYGGSGFVGRYITQRMARAGWRVRVAVRRPNEALFVKPYGAVGQVEPVFCNIRDDASVAAVMQGADAVINCVGILSKSGKNTFEAIHVDGAERIARIAAQQGVARLVHISAIGADAAAPSDYLRSKGEGEAAVLRHMPDAVILRPSVIFGPEDDFFNRFGAMTRKGPFLPIVGAETKFQPVYVDDVAKAAELAATGEAAAGVYELGGPGVATLRELMGLLLQEVYRRRIVIGLPFSLGGLIAFGGESGAGADPGADQQQCADPRSAAQPEGGQRGVRRRQGFRRSRHRARQSGNGVAGICLAVPPDRPIRRYHPVGPATAALSRFDRS